MRRPGRIAMAAALLLAGCRSFDNPSDPDAEGYTVSSQGFLKRLGDREPIAGDTLRLLGGLTSAPVEKAGLVVRYAWDLDDDGRTDTTLVGTDSLRVPMPAAGTHRLRLTLTDKAGFQSSDSLDVYVHPKLPDLFAITLPQIDPDCPAYAQQPLLMRLPLALSHFANERTRADGLSAADLALSLANALTGTDFPIGLLDGFDYTFSKGVYHFRNKTFALDAAFHYGPGFPGHAEGDTILPNLFDLDSYVTGVSTTVLPPSIRFSRGPLADLIEGDITADIDDIRHPRFDFRLDFNRLRFSFSRTTRTLFALSDQNLTAANALLFTLYEGKARIAPLYPGDLIRLYGRDSLEIDFSGTRIASPEAPLAWAYEHDGKRDTAVYRLSLIQTALRQNYRFGDADGVKKVFGEYVSVNSLGAVGDPLESVYFQGGYSSAAVDSARFYCKEAMEAGQFYGQADFETATAGQGHFESKRYKYAFDFPFSTGKIWEGGVDGVPEVLRGAVGK